MNVPLGGKLINRTADARTRRMLLTLALPSLEISYERTIEAWNIATGAYSPLTGFLGKKDVLSILKNVRLASGVFWPIPVILDIDEREKKNIGKSKKIFLTDAQGIRCALVEISEIYPFPKRLFEQGVYGTHDPKHPGVAKVRASKPYVVGGRITWLGGPLATIKPSFTPRVTRNLFAKKKWRRIVAFHTRNVPHRGHEHVQREGLKQTDGLLVQPLVGVKKKGDFRNEVVANAYRHFTAHVLPRGKAILSFLPYSPYFAGPREALLTAVIRKNFGCTHFIVGRDHTGVGSFYQVSDYARMIKKHERAMGIRILHFGKAFYCTKCQRAAFDETCPHEEKYRVHPSGTIIRRMLIEGKLPPAEMLRPAIARILLREKQLFV